jgi:hypothetical protein
MFRAHGTRASSEAPDLAAFDLIRLDMDPTSAHVVGSFRERIDRTGTQTRFGHA